MERKHASDYPQELLDLFNRYVHGEVDRRGFMDGAKKFATGGLTAAAIFESLRPNYAWAQQVPKTTPGSGRSTQPSSRRRAMGVSRATWRVRPTPPASCRECW